MSDYSRYKALEAARIGSSNEPNIAANAQAIVSQAHTREQSYPLTTQANANANIAETLLEVQPYAGRLASGNLTVPANLAANLANYSVLTVNKRTAGGAAVVAAVANLSNVAVTAFVPVPLTVANAANAQLAAGDVLTYTITGIGVALTTGTAAILDLSYEDI